MPTARRSVEQKGAFRYRQDSGGDEGDHRRAKSVQGRLHQGLVADLPEPLGNEQDNEKRGKHNPQGGQDAAGQAAHVVAHEGGDVDGEGAGGGFGNGDEIHDCLHIQPAVLHYHLGNHGDHGVAAADGEEADLEEIIEEKPQNHEGSPAFPFLARNSWRRIPQRAVETSRGMVLTRPVAARTKTNPRMRR